MSEILTKPQLRYVQHLVSDKTIQVRRSPAETHDKNGRRFCDHGYIAEINGIQITAEYHACTINSGASYHIFVKNTVANPVLPHSGHNHALITPRLHYKKLEAIYAQMKEIHDKQNNNVR